VDGNQLETATLSQARRASLGESLVAARERRGLSRETVVEETHIPAHYLRMLEDDDFRLISDRLYLLPFLRKYASFLELDPDEIAMRLLREVQRVDNNPSPVLDEPLDHIRRHRRRNWSKPILFGGLIAVIIGAYIAQSRHKDADSIAPPTPQSSPAPGLSMSSPSKETMNSSPTAPSTSAASLSPPDSTAVLQSAARTTTSAARGMRAFSQAIMMPVVSPDESPDLPQGRAQAARQAPNR
jgi:cytoskeletal protein RodZ